MRAHPGGPSADDADSDEHLLDGIRARDSAALRTLFQRYHRRVFHFVLRRLGDPGLAEEVVADVFFEVWRSIEHFAGASRPSTWIYGIAHFKSASAHRDRSRHKRASVVPTNVESLHRVADDGDVHDRLAAREDLRNVHRVLSTLPEDQRTVLELAVIEGLPYDEIADRLGLPEGTIKTRVSRARGKLRRGFARIDLERGG